MLKQSSAISDLVSDQNQDVESVHRTARVCYGNDSWLTWLFHDLPGKPIYLFKQIPALYVWGPWFEPPTSQMVP